MIFAHDRFQHSLFGQKMLHERFRANLRLQLFSHMQLRTLISHPPRRAPFINFSRDYFQYSLFSLNLEPV